MRKSRFSDEQVIAILREQEAGRPTAEVCRKHGVSNVSIRPRPQLAQAASAAEN